jgi:outer membrane protein assembly factor BamB
MRTVFLRLGVLGFALAALVAGGCTFVEPKDPPLKGKRIPVMLQGSSPGAENILPDARVAVAPPSANDAWGHAGGAASHAAYHLALAPVPRRVFSVSAGRGSNDDRRLLAQPVIDSQGRLFILDANARIYVLDAKTGKRLWARDLRIPDEQDGTLGGGVAALDGKVFVTTGFAQVLALDAANGRVLWRTSLSAPFRAAPTVADGRVFAVSTDNRTHAIDVESGKVLWTHRGSTELASLLGAAAPAYEAGIVVVAYSSGELFGLRAASGREAWSEFLSRRRNTSGIGTIVGIRASPVIDRGRVIAVSNSGQMVAVNLATGNRVWQRRIGAVGTPWAAGGYFYLITSDNVLLCLNRDDGRIVWSRTLVRYENEEKRRDWVSWSGPVLAGDRLIVAGSNKQVLSVSPYTGDLLGQISVPDGVEIAPIVARETLYILTRDAELIAWR